MSIKRKLKGIAPFKPLEHTVIKPISPLVSMTETDPYGSDRFNSAGEVYYHAGQDLHADIGTSVRAMLDGVVVRSFHRKPKTEGAISYGNIIVLYHGININTAKHTYSLYAHLSKRGVEAGDTVKRREVIGNSGNTENVPPHLHIEVKESPKRIVWYTSGNEVGDYLYGQYKKSPKDFLTKPFDKKPELDPFENQEKEREVTDADRKKFGERLRIKEERDRWGRLISHTVWAGNIHVGRCDIDTGEIKLGIPKSKFFAIVDGPKPMRRSGDARLDVKVDA